MNALRRSVLFRLLGILALLGQLLLPTLHSKGMAGGNGGSLNAAFCGYSPALLKQLRQVAPPELLSSIEKGRSASGKTTCTFCATVHGATLAGATDSQDPVLQHHPEAWPSGRPLVSVSWRISDIARARGPPQNLQV